MPNKHILKFYFPVKESTIAQLQCLTVDTLIHCQRQVNTVNKISGNYYLTTCIYIANDGQ